MSVVPRSAFLVKSDSALFNLEGTRRRPAEVGRPNGPIAQLVRAYD